MNGEFDFKVDLTGFVELTSDGVQVVVSVEGSDVEMVFPMSWDAIIDDAKECATIDHLGNMDDDDREWLADALDNAIAKLQMARESLK